jgi:hypothetical protein
MVSRCQSWNVVPSNFVSIKPLNGLLYAGCISYKMEIATSWPSLFPSMTSLRQCIPAMTRTMLKLKANLLIGPPVVSGPVPGSM